jgi:hypothetical protein
MGIVLDKVNTKLFLDFKLDLHPLTLLPDHPRDSN